MTDTEKMTLVKRLIDHHESAADEASTDVGAFVQEGGGKPPEAMVEPVRFHTAAVKLLREHSALIERVKALEEACQNARGLIDTPIGRRRHAEDPFYAAVVESLRSALPDATDSGRPVPPHGSGP